MNVLRLLMLLVCVFGLGVSCSSKRKATQKEYTKKEEMALDQAIDGFEAEEIESFEDLEGEEIVVDKSANDFNENAYIEDANTETSVMGTGSAGGTLLSRSMRYSGFQTPSSLPVLNTAKTSEYKVQEGETLMFISFKLYGDYRHWKHLAQMNKDKLGAGMSANAGVELSYHPPQNEFEWEPKGEPYLIKSGDSLSQISKRVYGKLSGWQKIYMNNKDMIRYPDLIFSGFTLYYDPKSSDLASK